MKKSTIFLLIGLLFAGHVAAEWDESLLIEYRQHKDKKRGRRGKFASKESARYVKDLSRKLGEKGEQKKADVEGKLKALKSDGKKSLKEKENEKKRLLREKLRLSDGYNRRRNNERLQKLALSKS